MLDQQRLFEQFTRLTGQDIRLGVNSSGELLEGTLQYTMFDSILLNTPKGKRVIAFSDLSFFDEVDSPQEK